MSNNEEIIQILERLKNIENKEKEKNGWFKLQVIIQSVGVILIPIVIVFTTDYLSKETTDREYNLAKITTDREYDLAKITTDAMKKQASVEEAMAIKNLVDLLTDNNKSRRELGIISLGFMLEKEDAEKILEKISKNEKDNKLKKTAEKTLETVINKINEENKDEFENLFSEKDIIRKQSYYSLREKQWEPFEIETIKYAINYANKNIDNHLGLVNTLDIFLRISKNVQDQELLLKNKVELNKLLNNANKSSNKYVKNYVKRVKKSLY